MTRAVRRCAPALTLLLLVACGGKPLPDWKISPTPSPNSKRVEYLQKITNSMAWQRSPYWRVNDLLDMPVFLIVADDRTACIAPAADWTIANPGDYYPCPGQWRIPRLQ